MIYRGDLIQLSTWQITRVHKFILGKSETVGICLAISFVPIGLFLEGFLVFDWSSSFIYRQVRNKTSDLNLTVGLEKDCTRTLVLTSSSCLYSRWNLNAGSGYSLSSDDSKFSSGFCSLNFLISWGMLGWEATHPLNHFHKAKIFSSVHASLIIMHTCMANCLCLLQILFYPFKKFTENNAYLCVSKYAPALPSKCLYWLHLN